MEKVLFEITQQLLPIKDVTIGKIATSSQYIYKDNNKYLPTSIFYRVDFMATTILLPSTAINVIGVIVTDNHFVMYGTEHYKGNLEDAYTAYKKANPSAPFRTWALDAKFIFPKTQAPAEMQQPKKQGGARPGAGRPIGEAKKRVPVRLNAENVERTKHNRSGIIAKALDLYFAQQQKTKQVCPKCSDYGIIQDSQGQNSTCPCHY